MGTLLHPITDADQPLQSLVARARAGEVVLLTDDGRPVARITAVDEKRERLLTGVTPERQAWLDKLKALRDSQSKRDRIDSATLVRGLRDGEAE